jgi:hypothetical protein
LVADIRSPAPPGLHYGVRLTPLAWRYLAACPPGGTYNYGHRRSQIGINIYARCPFLVIQTLFLFYVALFTCLYAIIHTYILDARH